MRLIDADKYLEYLDEKFGSVMMTEEHPLTLGLWEAEKIVRGMIALESIEAEPVVHGEWIKKFNGVRRNVSTNKDEANYIADCSICGFHTGNWCMTYKYCPMCGAKMGSDE